MPPSQHQYIDRSTGRVRDERLIGDRFVEWLYHPGREDTGGVFRSLTSSRASSLLGYLSYDTVLGSKLKSGRQILESWGADPAECLDDPDRLGTARKVFERKIRYWDCRPMDDDPGAVVSPSDSRMLMGSLDNESMLFLKDKFFGYQELIGGTKTRWLRAFHHGDYAVFRLTPDKYHYNHTPVAGRIIDFYEIEGAYNSCNPTAVVSLVTPYSKNRRVVTVIDTDTKGGTRCGLVAMVEVVALMVGGIVSCYSEESYDAPRPCEPGMMLRKGRPKSLFRPGSSTVVLLFQPGRIEFAPDIVQAQRRSDVSSRFSSGFNRPLVETDVPVRSTIAVAKGDGSYS